MNRRGWRWALLALVLALTSCGRTGQPVQEEGPLLWYRSDGQTGHGPALASQPYEGEEPLQPEALLTALLAGPTQEDLVTPFPRGVALFRCQWDEERPGVLLVELSEQYGALGDISLTLADYCIVLTLSQIEGVESVEIAAQGHWASYRSHQQLSAEEAVLWDELAEEAP